MQTDERGGGVSKYEILIGDCRQTLKTLPSESVSCCVTSPPYFGLRDYGNEDQIGLEETPEEFVAALVDVFREVRRVLRDDGTVWLNLGDSYAGSWGAQGRQGKNGQMADRSVVSARQVKAHPMRTKNTGSIREAGLKPKDLIGIPWRVAFALQADGWYLRQDIIWHKPNPMPESVRDRCTKAHEYIFLLSKSPKYYYDYDAIKETAIDPRGPGNVKPVRELPGERAGENSNIRGSLHKIGAVEKRNKRSVWTVSTQPYTGAHFATFPPGLIEACILAGSPEGGTVLDPFGGSGTTAGVAIGSGRDAVLCELNPRYADLIEERVRSVSAWAHERRAAERQIDLLEEAL